MKKLGFLAAFLAVGMLASCGVPGGGSTAPAIDAETGKRAIEAAKDESIAFVSRATVLIPDNPTSIGQSNDYWNNDYLYLTTHQTVLDEVSGKDLVVDIEWIYDTADTFVKEKIVNDETHISVYFNYSKTEEHDFPFKAKFTCGAAEAQEVSYQVHLLKKNLDFLELSIKDIYKTTAANDNFDLVDPETGFYKKNNESFPYTCVETQGEVVYIAPDGNWALIGDGEYILQLYSGSALDLNANKYPALTVGNTVRVMAELGSYYGNCQISFIFGIVQGDSSKITKPTTYKAMAGADFSGKHYWEGGLMNSTKTVNAVYKGNLMQNNKAVEASALTNGRFTFDVEVDGVKLSVAYDYHVDREGKLGIFDAFKAKLSSLSVGSALAVKGTVRFAGPVQKSYKGNESASTWSIVPFLADHMA